MPTGGLDHGVIVADDSALVRDNVRSVLDPPWRVFMAANGNEALQFARSVRAALILLDVRMPQMDGIDACTRIRMLPHHQNTPIVMLTAYDEDDVRRRARKAGATTLFRKPFTIDKLRAGLAPLLAAGLDAGARGEAARTEHDADSLIMESDGLSLDYAVLSVCRQAEAAIAPRGYASFVEAALALRNEFKH